MGKLNSPRVVIDVTRGNETDHPGNLRLVVRVEEEAEKVSALFDAYDRPLSE